jgi:hypothetical protein
MNTKVQNAYNAIIELNGEEVAEMLDKLTPELLLSFCMLSMSKFSDKFFDRVDAEKRCQ